MKRWGLVITGGVVIVTGLRLVCHLAYEAGYESKRQKDVAILELNSRMLKDCAHVVQCPSFEITQEVSP